MCLLHCQIAKEEYTEKCMHQYMHALGAGMQSIACLHGTPKPAVLAVNSCSCVLAAYCVVVVHMPA